MQLKKVLKWLILTIPALTIIACSSHKSTNNQAEFKMDTSNGTIINTSKDNNLAYFDEKESLYIQELKHKNIVYFDLEKYDIKSNFTQILDSHANFLRRNHNYIVTIEGHTDERGTPEYNIALGERRANAVSMYLQGKGVSINQISIISYGKEKPAILGHQESAYAKNRRAIIVY